MSLSTSLIKADGSWAQKITYLDGMKVYQGPREQCICYPSGITVYQGPEGGQCVAAPDVGIKTVSRGLKCQRMHYNSECLTIGVGGGYISVIHGPQGKNVMFKRSGFSEASVIRDKLPFQSSLPSSDYGNLSTDDKDLSSSSSSDYFSALSNISQEDGENGKVKALAQPRVLATFNERQEVHEKGPTQAEPEVEATLDQSLENTDDVQLFIQEFPTFTKPETPKSEKKLRSGCCNFL